MDWFAIVTALSRGCHLAASLSLFGCLVFQRFVLPAPERVWFLAINRLALLSASLALLFGALWLMAVSATMAGAISLDATFDALCLVAERTDFGNYVCARLVLLVVAIAGLPIAGLPRRRSMVNAGLLLVAGGALALQPFIGHIGQLPGAERVLIPVEMAHLLAAGAWLGGLLPLLLIATRAPADLSALVCERFTPVGLLAVGTIAVTALPQAFALIGGPPQFFGTQYGHFALLKIALFIVALSFAGVNRLVLTTKLRASGPMPARRVLIGSVVLETVVVFCVVFAAAAMASSPPAAHVQPVWPFAWRPSTEAWDEPELRGELVRLLIAAAAGVVLIAASLALRRFRLLAIVVAVIVIAPFTPSLSLLFVEAYPTSYMHSTTGFSAEAIVHGQLLFQQRCAACHAPREGSGGGADLTAPHLWGHLDGELYWWVTNGVADWRGNAVMPAFGSVLSEQDRWSLIDFIRARNIGVQISKTGKWQPPVPAPATPLICAGRDADEIGDLARHVLLVVAGGDSATVKAPDHSDAIPIELVRGEAGTPPSGQCVADSAFAWDAWAILAGVTQDAFTGYQVVVDPQGWMRAVLPPGTAAEALQAAIRDAEAHPIAGGARPEAHHH